jgi:phosphonate transport system substrate-binding protein
MSRRPLLLGAVAYDAKVVAIWAGFRSWFRSQDVEFDFVLYSNYERQVLDLLDGRIDIAWNSPLAWVRARRLAAAQGADVRPIAMRDTDLDLTSVVVARTDSALVDGQGLTGHVLGTGAIDSPQATLLPLALLRGQGLQPGQDFQVRRFDTGVGLHGDHIGGEREAARALVAGEVDAASMTDTNLLLFSRDGTLPPASVRVIAQTAPYDHCNMTAGPSGVAELTESFSELLLSMSYDDATVRPLLDLEGLKRWQSPRTSGYAALERAVDESDFYDEKGAVIAVDYRP